MNANIYITKELFNGRELTENELVHKINLLNIEAQNIDRYKDENFLYITEECYTDLKWQGYVLANIWELNCSLDRDAKNILQKLISNYSNSTSLSHADVVNSFKNNSEGLVNAIILFSNDAAINQYHQILISGRSWYDFRRYFLGKYPSNAIYFIDECSKYFDRIYFHERNKLTVGAILKDCSMMIVKHLSALNDHFHSIITMYPHLNRQEKLDFLSATHDFDEKASLEGDASRKKNFTFNFNNGSTKNVSVCCEPHIKLCHTDKYPGDKSYSTNRRIYFHEGLSNFEDGKILVGHIGLHL